MDVTPRFQFVAKCDKGQRLNKVAGRESQRKGIRRPLAGPAVAFLSYKWPRTGIITLTQNFGTREKRTNQIDVRTRLIPRCGSLPLEFEVSFAYNSASLLKENLPQKWLMLRKKKVRKVTLTMDANDSQARCALRHDEIQFLCLIICEKLAGLSQGIWTWSCDLEDILKKMSWSSRSQDQA